MKSILVFNAPKYRISAAESILLCLLKAREESFSLELLMESSWPLTIHNFADELKIPIYFTGKVEIYNSFGYKQMIEYHSRSQPNKGDCANINYLLALKGAASNEPCPLCWMKRETTQNPACKKENVVKTLKDYDAFYQRGEPRLLSDWETGELGQINPQLQQLMIASDIERVDHQVIPGFLHFKLRNGLNICLLKKMISYLSVQVSTRYSKMP